MKILIFGANERTGQQLVAHALALGHTVSVVVQKPLQFTISCPRLRVVAGDALNSDSFADVMNGQEVVVSALGITGVLNSLRPMTFHVETTRNIIAQMKVHNVRRFMGITSVGVIHDPTTPFLYRTIVQPLLQHKYEDMRKMENVVQTSGLDWTIVRPVQLTDGPLTQVYRIGLDGKLQNGATISRADVADFILGHVEKAAYLNQPVALSY